MTKKKTNNKKSNKSSIFYTIEYVQVYILYLNMLSVL